MSRPSRGPRLLANILSDLFAVRGYSRPYARQQLEDAWNIAVGEPYCRQTQLGEVQCGVLNVTVAHSALLEELAAFHKAAILKVLRLGAPATTVNDIRFQVGRIGPKIECRPAMALPSSAEAKPARYHQFAPRQRAQPGKRCTPDCSSGENSAQP
jgi:Dna[CI] antecedent, DciA